MIGEDKKKKAGVRFLEFILKNAIKFLFKKCIPYDATFRVNLEQGLPIGVK